MQQVFDLAKEPRGETLHRLIRGVGRLASSVMMVIRDDIGIDEGGRRLLSRLGPHMLERRRGSSWPGTTLLSDTATIYRFTAVDEVLDEVIGASDTLYGWQQPALPVDLSFLRYDGTELLATVSHERDAYLKLEVHEHEALASVLPELDEIVTVPPVPDRE